MTEYITTVRRVVVVVALSLGVLALVAGPAVGPRGNHVAQVTISPTGNQDGTG
jgi:hypothetical protein